MAGNQKQKRKKKKAKRALKPKPTRSAPRRSVAQLVFIGFGILIILSMVISAVAYLPVF